MTGLRTLQICSLYLPTPPAQLSLGLLLVSRGRSWMALQPCCGRGLTGAEQTMQTAAARRRQHPTGLVLPALKELALVRLDLLA